LNLPSTPSPTPPPPPHDSALHTTHSLEESRVLAAAERQGGQEQKVIAAAWGEASERKSLLQTILNFQYLLSKSCKQKCFQVNFEIHYVVCYV